MRKSVELEKYFQPLAEEKISFPMENGTNQAPIYRTDHYCVLPDTVGYIIVNTRTGVKEGASEVLPSAISKCDMWSELMEEIKGRKFP